MALGTLYRHCHLIPTTTLYKGFPGGSDGKESACNVGDQGSIPGLGRSRGEGNGNPLQYSYWRIPWTEEPGGLQFIGLQESEVTEHEQEHNSIKDSFRGEP